MIAAQVFGRDSENAHAVQTECTFCKGVIQSAYECFKRIRKKKEKAHAVHVSPNRKMECKPRKCFRCGYEDHMIAKYQKQESSNEKGNRACNIGENISDWNIYASMARMSSNDKWKNHGNTENWDRKIVQEGW